MFEKCQNENCDESFLQLIYYPAASKLRIETKFELKVLSHNVALIEPNLWHDVLLFATPNSLTVKIDSYPSYTRKYLND